MDIEDFSLGLFSLAGRNALVTGGNTGLDCLYDDNQTSAIEDPGLPADTFEHFVWNALP